MEKKSEKSLENVKIQELQGEVDSMRQQVKAYIDEIMETERQLLTEAIYLTKNPNQKPMEVKKLQLPNNMFDTPKEESPMTNLITLNTKANSLLECIKILKKSS